MISRIIRNTFVRLFPFLLWLSSCKKTSEPVPVTVLKHWDIVLDTKFQVPAIAGRTETGTVSIDLYSDNALVFVIHISNLASGDAATNAYIQSGDALNNGPLILDLAANFSNGNAAGKMMISSGLFDSLKYAKTDLYVNITTNKLPNGLLRGQVDNPVIFAADVNMTGANVVPSISTNATGTALLRITADKILYCKINVNALENGDTLIYSHLHAGLPGAIGNVILQLCSTAADYGRVLKILSSDDNLTDLRAGLVYINIHSTKHPAGLVRGQVIK